MQTRPRVLVAAVALVCLLVVAVALLGPDESSTSALPDAIPTSAPEEGPPAPSPWATAPDISFGGEATAADSPFVEGVPVPSHMILWNHDRYGAQNTLRGNVWQAAWHLPDDLSRSDVDAFYDDAMPEGADFGQWRWCRMEQIDSQLHETQRLYEKPGTDAILDVTIYDTGVLIGTDESGPCGRRD